MIVEQYFVQFKSYIYLKITKFSNVNPYFFLVISSSLVVHSSAKPKFIVSLTVLGLRKFSNGLVVGHVSILKSTLITIHLY
jgi:hypothetical protein